jgi:hypothetical protein
MKTKTQKTTRRISIIERARKLQRRGYMPGLMGHIAKAYEAKTQEKRASR